MSTQREWTTIREYDDILFDYYNGIARITINRERYRNAFTPTTTAEMSDALRICREEADIDVIVITGAGDKAFCSGGDQNVKGRGGYIGKDGVPRLSVLDVQKQIRSIPKPVIAAVNGFAIGGGHVLHVVCDLSIASENAIFGQTGPRVGSFDAGFGASYLARVVGQFQHRCPDINCTSQWRRKLQGNRTHFLSGHIFPACHGSDFIHVLHRILTIYPQEYHFVSSHLRCSRELYSLACVRVLLLFYHGDVPRLLCRYDADQDADFELYCDGTFECGIQLYPDFRKIRFPAIGNCRCCYRLFAG